MIGTSFVLWTLAVAAILISRRATGDFLSPPALVVGVWCVTGGLYFLFLLPYVPLSDRSAALIASALACLVAGMLLGGRIVRRRLGETERARLSEEGPARWIGWYALIGWTGFLWYAFFAVGLFGWAGLRQGWRIRWALGDRLIPSGFLFLEFFCIVTPLLALACLLTGARVSRGRLLAAASCVVPLWLTTDRTQFFMLTLTALWMYLLRHGPRLSAFRYARAVALCGVLLIAQFLAVGWWVGKTPEHLGAKLDVDRILPPPAAGSIVRKGASRPSIDTQAIVRAARKFLRARTETVFRHASTLYVYATCSYPALSGLLEDPPEMTMGRRTFFPVFRLAQRAGLPTGPLPDVIPPFRKISYEANLATNAYSFLRDPYLDFSVVGLLGVPFVIGGISGVLYGIVRRRRDAPLPLVGLALICMGLTLSVLFNKFNDTATWYIGLMTSVPFLVEARRLAARDGATGRARRLSRKPLPQGVPTAVALHERSSSDAV